MPLAVFVKENRAAPINHSLLAVHKTIRPPNPIYIFYPVLPIFVRNLVNTEWDFPVCDQYLFHDTILSIEISMSVHAKQVMLAMSSAFCKIRNIHMLTYIHQTHKRLRSCSERTLGKIKVVRANRLWTRNRCTRGKTACVGEIMRHRINIDRHIGASDRSPVTRP